MTARPRRPRGLLTRLTRAGERPDELESIVAHLHLLLNTRVGEALCAADFGVIDFADVVHSFPAATQALQQSIRATILQYEPRLRNVVVQPVTSADTLTLAFEISARLRKQTQSVRLWTEMTASGRIQVSRQSS